MLHEPRAFEGTPVSAAVKASACLISAAVTSVTGAWTLEAPCPVLPEAAPEAALEAAPEAEGLLLG